MTRRVVFLVECAPAFGVGHLSRSLVLAGALAGRGAEVRFALTTPDCLDSAPGFPATLAADAAPPDDLLIVDGYRIGAAAIAPWAEAAKLAVLIDDTADRPRPCDALVNFMLYAEACDYSAYPAQTRLIGPRYAPIRPGFATLRHDNLRTAPRALVSFGGGSTSRFGVDVARALAARFTGPVDLALGRQFDGSVAAADLPANVLMDRDADMVARMSRATLYVGSLGTTFLEALSAGLLCITARVAEDQGRIARTAREMGIAVFDPPDAAAVAEAAAAALADPAPPVLPEHPDGAGAARLADALLALDSR